MSVTRMLDTVQRWLRWLTGDGDTTAHADTAAGGSVAKPARKRVAKRARKTPTQARRGARKARKP